MLTTTRRHFVKTTATTLAIGTLTRPARAAVAARTRVGIIGSTGRGDYGHGVDVAFTQLPHVEIVALADADAAGRAAAQQRTNPHRTYADYREMLAQEKLDLVAICPRWIDQHLDMILAAAEAGCHVYMEKPFCPTLLACDQAVAALDARGLKLAIAHISQYSPVLTMVQQLIADDAIGEILELRGRGKEDQRGGGEDLWVLGSHIFGLMRSVASSDPITCSSVVQVNQRGVTAADVVPANEGIGLLAGDHVQATYAFPGGATGYFASRRQMAGTPSRFALQIFGSKGIIEMESGYGVKAHLLRDGSWSPGRSKKNWEAITSAGLGQAEPRDDGTYQGGHVAAINDLLDSVTHDRPPKCSAHDARAIVEMIVAVFEAHRVGGLVAMPLANRHDPLAALAETEHHLNPVR